MMWRPGKLPTEMDRLIQVTVCLLSLGREEALFNVGISRFSHETKESPEVTCGNECPFRR